MLVDEYKIKTALISVSDKTGIVEFAQKLSERGIIIYSTGGTEKLLKENNVPAKSVTELTNFPEILNGRVKTLHPAVHAGLLADLGVEEHRNQIEKLNINSIDLLVVNLYPFEKTLKKEGVTHEELIENIDIGGPTMIRSAAKNYKWTAVVVNPSHYQTIIDYIDKNGAIPEEFRVKLAGEVFNHTAAYDALIAKYFNKINNIEFPETLTLSYRKVQDCRYGENSHQPAAVYGDFLDLFKKLHGKELSYNNIVDISAIAELMLEFDSNKPTVAIVKHTNPCGVATADNFVDAYKLAFATDTVSPFGGIVAINGVMDKDFASEIHSLFTEVIIASEFTPEALEILTKKRDRRLIVANFDNIRNSIGHAFKSIPSGMLYQRADKLLCDGELKVVTKRKPSDEEMEALIFGWKIAKHVKSNAIVYAAKNRTLGIGAGQMSRVDSSRIAVEKAQMGNIDLKNSVVASDAFFPFADALMEAVNAGATAVIQPGGSVRDEEVIKAADENNIAMVFTGMRHFRH